jgi:acyl-CoA synthetase (AMP-forming)/AMP-acid ligase II
MADMEAFDCGDVATLAELVERRAKFSGARRALTFLQDGESEHSHLSYRELDRQARSVAAWLQANGYAGERVLLLYPSGLEFVVAFMGCLYAGAIAVPAYPPRMNRNILRLTSIIADAGAVLAFTTAAHAGRTQRLLEEAGIRSMRVAAIDEMPADSGASWQTPSATTSQLAFLQYTSGSTSHPKGVMVSHGNLLANHEMMRHSFGQSSQTKIVTWLPLFHDMGLIGNVLQALYLGAECLILPPEVFMVKPLRWLEAISRYRATFSGAPNFAYDLCAAKIAPEQRTALDLSCWESAFVGAEPVRHETLERFSATFAPSGFRKEALYPCYGLAEATLFASGAGKLTGGRSAWFKAEALEQNRVTETAKDHPGARALVSCGHPWLNERIAIVHPETGERCGTAEIGEIWVSGPHVAQGYWDRPDETEVTFGAHLLHDTEAGYLRTGDLGFIHEGGLFIAGRLKDLIIVAGRNHDPVDIEQTAQASHPSIRPGGCAAFQVEVRGEQRLVLAAELERSAKALLDDTKPIRRAVREAVALNHDLATYDVVCLRAASLPKTSSGKIQRHACRAAYIDRTFKLWNPQE